MAKELLSEVDCSPAPPPLCKLIIFIVAVPVIADSGSPRINVSQVTEDPSNLLEDDSSSAKGGHY